MIGGIRTAAVKSGGFSANNDLDLSEELLAAEVSGSAELSDRF